VQEKDSIFVPMNNNDMTTVEFVTNPVFASVAILVVVGLFLSFRKKEEKPPPKTHLDDLREQIEKLYHSLKDQIVAPKPLEGRPYSIQWKLFALLGYVDDLVNLYIPTFFPQKLGEYERISDRELIREGAVKIVKYQYSRHGSHLEVYVAYPLSFETIRLCSPHLVDVLGQSLEGMSEVTFSQDETPFSSSLIGFSDKTGLTVTQLSLTRYALLVVKSKDGQRSGYLDFLASIDIQGLRTLFAESDEELSLPVVGKGDMTESEPSTSLPQSNNEEVLALAAPE
jgi:hypothetical protein